MNIRHTGACSERFLNARAELYPLKQQYSLFTNLRIMRDAAIQRAITLVYLEEKFGE